MPPWTTGRFWPADAEAIAAAATGLIAGEEVNVEGASRDKLMTHRNLNAIVTTIASGMAVWRARHEEPTTGYFGAGIVEMAILAYTAYLGGELVYESGVGVAPARGVYRPGAPTLRTDQMGAFVGAAATDLAHGAQHMAQELRQGYFIPAIAGNHSERQPSPRQQVATPA